MKRMVFLLVALLLLLTACGGTGEEAEGFTVYYAAEGSEFHSAIAGEEWVLPEDKNPIEGALSLLSTAPLTPGLSSPCPEGVRVRGWQLEGGVLYVDFNEAYGSLTGIQLTLADYCITLTLTQLEGVEQVVITAAGEELPERASQLLSPEDVLLQDENQNPVTLQLHLWFPTDSGSLGAEYREIKVPGDSGRVMAVLRAMCAGPENRNYRPFLPETADGVAVWAEGDTCCINFPAAWVDFLTGAEAPVPIETAFQAIAGVLVELEGVKTVHFLAQGEFLSAWSERAVD